MSVADSGRGAMPGRWRYAAAVVLLLAGLASAGWLLWTRLAEIEAGLVRTAVPGSIVLTLDKPGDYTIFHERRSLIDGKLYIADNITGLRIGVTAEATGAALAVEPVRGSESYSFDGHDGEAVLTFAVKQPGRYRLAARFDDGRAEAVTVLAVGHDFLGLLLRTLMGTIGLVLGSIVVAAVIVGITYQQRRRARRAAATTLAAQAR